MALSDFARTNFKQGRTSTRFDDIEVTIQTAVHRHCY